MLFAPVVTVTILEDTLPEDDESFTVQLVNPGGGASVGSDDHITVIILANDNVAGVLGFNTTSILAQEGVYEEECEGGGGWGEGN